MARRVCSDLIHGWFLTRLIAHNRQLVNFYFARLASCVYERARHARQPFLFGDGPLHALCPKPGQSATTANMASVRLLAATCALHTFHTFSQAITKSMHRQGPPCRIPTSSCILCILFILVFIIERDIKKNEEKEGTRHGCNTYTPPLHPVSSETSMQSMQSALAEL